MRVLSLEPPQEVLDLLDRRRRGADRWDEMWSGVLHVVPMPNGVMQRFDAESLHTVDGKLVITWDGRSATV